MGENQLSGTALLNIHPEIMIKPDEISDTFSVLLVFH